MFLFRTSLRLLSHHNYVSSQGVPNSPLPVKTFQSSSGIADNDKKGQLNPPPCDIPYRSLHFQMCFIQSTWVWIIMMSLITAKMMSADWIMWYSIAVELIDIVEKGWKQIAVRTWKKFLCLGLFHKKEVMIVSEGILFLPLIPMRFDFHRPPSLTRSTYQSTLPSTNHKCNPWTIKS